MTILTAQAIWVGTITVYSDVNSSGLCSSLTVKVFWTQKFSETKDLKNEPVIQML